MNVIFYDIGRANAERCSFVHVNSIYIHAQHTELKRKN